MNKIYQNICKSFELSNPNLLRNILFLAFMIRLVSVIFSKGFGMLDDHFLVIEASQSWVDGTDYNNWLPSSGAKTPDGHSYLYSGIHFVLFTIIKFFGINNPQYKMYIIRLLHAFFSLITVACGFKIADKLSGKQAARFTGILLALFWFMPWLSVRNLVEITCIPFMMWGSWTYVRALKEKQSIWQYLNSGLIIGLAVDIRFQVVFFVIGFGFGMLLLKQWKEAFLWSIGVIFSFCLIQFFVDLSIWGYPFAEFIEYVKYNMDNAYNYVMNPWYSYLLLVLGILLPPLSFILFFGFLRSYKFQWALFAGTLLFFLFHSYFPNKQERFILPVVPMIITLGAVGWVEFYNKSKFWLKHKGVMKTFLIIFWSINLFLLPFVSAMYSKKSRVESMTYLSKYPNLKCIMLEDIYKDQPDMPPLFYTGQWPIVFNVAKNSPLDSIQKKLLRWGPTWNPRFVLFFDDKDIGPRVDSIKKVVPNLEYETTVKPSFIDDVMFRLNPRNTNQTIVIYRNDDFFPKKIE
jgi:hypothetical protein